jgi:hypothetical protein
MNRDLQCPAPGSAGKMTPKTIGKPMMTASRSFDFRERYNVQDLNILAHSNLASPNPIQRDLTPGLSESGNYGHRQRFSAAS